MRTKNRLQVLMAVAAVTVGVSIALGSSITSIGALDPGTGTAESAVRAISADGQYAVGYSNGTATIYDMFGNPSTFTGQVPVVWKAGVLTQLPMTADGWSLERANHTVATGVLVRYNSTLGVDEIAIGGGFLQSEDPFKWQMCYYKAPVANIGGGYWRDNTLANPIAGIVGPYNTVRMRTTMTGDTWFVAGDRSGSIKTFNMGLDGTSSYEVNGHNVDGVIWDAVGNSVNGAGRSAGFIKESTLAADPYTNPRRAAYLNGINSDVQTPIPGGSQFDSEAVGISPDPNNIILCGVDFSDTANSKAFVWKPGDASMTLLNPLAGDTLAGAIDVRLIDGDFITAGYSSNGTLEQAVIWDTTGTWSSTGQAVLVSAVLSNDGVNMSQWSSLTRVTSISNDGKTIAGYGVWAADGTTRGFVANRAAAPTVVGRKIFYNNSYYDGNKIGVDPAPGAGARDDDADAIDPSKSPLMAGGGAATFANWTGYAQGINGLIYDVQDPTRTPVAGDFSFRNIGKAGTTLPGTVVTPNAFVAYQLAPNVVRCVMTFASTGGSTPSGTVQDCWLKVDIGTGFGAAAETHYWGNARCDGGTVSGVNILVTAQDEIDARNNPHTIANRALVDDAYDYNKDSLVSSADQILARNNKTTLATCVKIVTK